MKSVFMKIGKLESLFTSGKIKSLSVRGIDGGFVQVFSVFNKGLAKCLRIKTADGRTIECSNEHKFLTEDLSEISAKDAEWIMTDAGYVQIISKENILSHDVYDLKCDSPNTYKTSNGVFHHNSGKSFAALTAVKLFLDANPGGYCMYFESESAISKDMIESRGIDTSRIAIVPVVTVQEFRTSAVKILDKYIESDKKRENRPPLLFVLDSLGMLSTTKEIEDTAEGSETKDMTRSQIIKAAFRVLTLKLGRANVTMLVTTHTFACLTAGHNVKTPFGIKDIKDIVVGNEVMTLEGYQKITSTCSYENIKTVKIEMEDGTIINCSPEHKFFNTTHNEWVSASNLCEGMDLKVV